MKLRLKEQIKAEFTHIAEEQLEEGIVEKESHGNQAGNEHSICHIKLSFLQKLSQRKRDW